MTTVQDRSHESIINDTLARLLRDRLGFSAVAETLREGGRPDIIVRLPQKAPVVLEIEVEPASTVVADALSRLGMEIDGHKVQNVFAIAVPARIRTVSQQYLYDELGAATLEWQEWSTDGSFGPKYKGNFLEVGDAVSRASAPFVGFYEALLTLERGVEQAGARLYESPGTVARVAKVFGIEPGDESAKMAALVIINAMIFQERLADTESVYRTLGSTVRNGVYSRNLLLEIWDSILAVDYYPIFGMARAVVQELSQFEAAEVLKECAETAEELIGTGAVGRHDLAGYIFNRLVNERKLFAAFYTSIPASVLLAGLALSPERWARVDWSSSDEVAKLRVVDPACGTGTLLLASYRQIVQNRAVSGVASNAETSLHRALVEETIFGADVVQAAIHLTAASLAAMSPTVRFDKMQLHTLRFGKYEEEQIKLGSLDWLEVPEIQSFFSATEEQVGPMTGTGALVARPRADLVITNPPYTRRGADGGKVEAIAKVFSVPEGDSSLAKRTSELLRDSPANLRGGHGTSFLVLADRLINPGGTIAFVLPATSLFGEQWKGIRQMLAERYSVDFVVSSHAPESTSLSFDTSIAEILLVARKLKADEESSGRARFINIWRPLNQETEALALTKVINSLASVPVIRSDGPPMGGTPLMVGGEQWGEIVDGPVGTDSWTAARWKNAATNQFARSLELGELWNEYGSEIAGNVPVAPMGEVCNVGPQHRKIHGSIGVFQTCISGWDEQAQFPAMWHFKSSVYQSVNVVPNAHLIPRPLGGHEFIWSQSGTLQITCDVRYNAQSIMAAQTNERALGARSWHSLIVSEPERLARENALCLWCNSSLGLFLHANHANRTQYGRGLGNMGMLESMLTLDVRQFTDWQLQAAGAIWRDFQNRKFLPFYQCAVDPARIELDERMVREVLGLGEDAVASVARIRTLLASDPSIHGSKDPELG